MTIVFQWPPQLSTKSAHSHTLTHTVTKTVLLFLTAHCPVILCLRGMTSHGAVQFIMKSLEVDTGAGLYGRSHSQPTLHAHTHTHSSETCTEAQRWHTDRTMGEI